MLTDAQQVGKRLRQLRRELAAKEERDVEGVEIATAVGVSDAAYSRYELGKRIPKPEVLARLAKHFGVTKSFLRYGETADPIPEEPSGEILGDGAASKKDRSA